METVRMPASVLGVTDVNSRASSPGCFAGARPDHAPAHVDPSERLAGFVAPEDHVATSQLTELTRTQSAPRGQEGVGAGAAPAWPRP